MNLYRQLQKFEYEKILPLIAAIGLISMSIFIALMLILYPLTIKADDIMPADYPNAVLINLNIAKAEIEDGMQ